VMDAFLAIASRREMREYSDQALPGEVVTRILEAGRITGSSTNKQPWLFIVVEDRERVEQLAQIAYTPQNILTAKLVVAVAVRGKRAFDAGRATQNMLLAAWNEGVGSCPNGIKDSEKAAETLGLDDDESPVIILTFGYPARARDPQSRSPEEWIARANRKPFDEVVKRR
jgi:nitroreductase